MYRGVGEGRQEEGRGADDSLFGALEWLLVAEMAEQYSWGSGVRSGLPRCPCLPGEFFGLTKGPFNPLWCPSGEKSPGLVVFPPSARLSGKPRSQVESSALLHRNAERICCLYLRGPVRSLVAQTAQTAS